MAFTPRLNSNGMQNNPYWYSQNPFYPEYGLPNCTCYAWGRFWECANPGGGFEHRPTLSLADAQYWYSYTADGYQRGQIAKLGAIICFSGGLQGDGHVGVVEQINPDGSIVTSNSAWQGAYFYTETLPADYSHPNYVFQGFIYNPYIDPGPSPIPTKRNKLLLLINKRKFMKRRNLSWR